VRLDNLSLRTEESSLRVTGTVGRIDTRQPVVNLQLSSDKLALNELANGREAVISRQQAEMLELSTPVVKLWDGVLALPLIGTLDSNRTQSVMEALLTRVVASATKPATVKLLRCTFTIAPVRSPTTRR